MLKRATILHGTNGAPSINGWQKTLKSQLETVGYEVYFPHLPGSNKPSLELYDAFLQNSGWDFVDNLIVGHSSGSTALLHLLGQDWFPRVETAVLVGTFLDESRLGEADWYESGQFDALFVEQFDVDKITKMADQFIFVHGDDDPYCDYGRAQQLCGELGGAFITVEGGGHLSSSTREEGLAELTDELKRRGVL